MSNLKNNYKYLCTLPTRLRERIVAGPLMSPKGSTLIVLSLLTLPPASWLAQSPLLASNDHYSHAKIKAELLHSFETLLEPATRLAASWTLLILKLKPCLPGAYSWGGQQTGNAQVKPDEHVTEAAQAEIFGLPPHLLSLQLSCTPFLLHYLPGLGLGIISFFMAYCSVVPSKSCPTS